MNQCDHNHETRSEIRKLLVSKADSSHGSILVCHRHYLREIAFRRSRAPETDPVKWEYPTWESLTVVQPAVTTNDPYNTVAHRPVSSAEESKAEISIHQLDPELALWLHDHISITAAGAVHMHRLVVRRGAPKNSKMLLDMDEDIFMHKQALEWLHTVMGGCPNGHGK